MDQLQLVEGLYNYVHMPLIMQACWSLLHFIRALPEVHAIEPWANSPSLIYKQKFRDMYDGFIKKQRSALSQGVKHIK